MCWSMGQVNHYSSLYTMYNNVIFLKFTHVHPSSKSLMVQLLVSTYLQVKLEVQILVYRHV